MSSRRLAVVSLTTAILAMVVAVAGFIIALVLNTFFLDKYDAYGQVPVPGSGSLYLPAGEITVSFHTVVIGSTNGGLPVPSLGVTITPPEGVAQPVVTESVGSTTTVNNDAHIRVWVAKIPVSGTYNVTTDGQVNGYIDPRLAFGHKSSYGWLVWLFVAIFVAGLVGSIVSGWWLARARRKAVVAASPDFPPAFHPSVPDPRAAPTPAPRAPIAAAHEPGDEGVRLERLKTLAALRDSGALSHEEFETEKRRILGGY
jgi:Short C-terminal domain